MNVAVIAAGLAGLSAACELSEGGHSVTLFEKRPWAGGKAYSFEAPDSGSDDTPVMQIDNGQHIAMRCTTAYNAFLEKLGTAHLIKWQDRMRVPVFDADGHRSELRADPLPAPLHLLASFAAYRHLSVGNKIRVARAMIAVRRARLTEQLDQVSFADWLQQHSQTERVIEKFWDLIVVPALNCRCEDAAASQALFVFQQGFLKSATSAAVGVPTVGLSQLHVDPAIRYVEARGGDVRRSAAVERIETSGERVESLLLADGQRLRFDAYVLALPPDEALNVLPPEVTNQAPFADLARFRSSPIVNLHLWFDGPVADFDFAAFTGCDVQWMFRPQSHASASVNEHIVISLSAAQRYMTLDKRELVELLLPQLRRALPLAGERRLLRSAVIKEPDATFVPSPGLHRPAPETPLLNLVLAGAYTNTGWPATMESAVRSGTAAARALSLAEQRIMSRPTVSVA